MEIPFELDERGIYKHKSIIIGEISFRVNRNGENVKK